GDDHGRDGGDPAGGRAPGLSRGRPDPDGGRARQRLAGPDQGPSGRRDDGDPAVHPGAPRMILRPVWGGQDEFVDKDLNYALDLISMDGATVDGTNWDALLGTGSGLSDIGNMDLAMLDQALQSGQG